MQTTTYVLYHGNCPDGTGAALAAWWALGEIRVEYIPVVYGQPPPALKEGSIVYVLDFSYPREVLEGMMKRAQKLHVLDHHATAERELAGLPNCVFDLNKSGAVLAWEHFHPGEEAPLFFRYLQDRDLWKFELQSSREISMALQSYPMDFRKWNRHISRLTELAEEGEVCRRLIQQQVAAMARNAGWALFELPLVQSAICGTVRLCGTVRIYPRQWMECVDEDRLGPPQKVVAPCANASVAFSEVGQELLALWPNYLFAAYYFDRADGKRQWGLRSRCGFDCSVLAKQMGGGGHPQAAGFITDVP